MGSAPSSDDRPADAAGEGALGTNVEFGGSNWLVRAVRKHDDDLYRGNGRPGLTTRVAVCEKEQEEMKQTVESMKTTLRAVAIMGAGTLLSVLLEIIIRLATGKG